MLKKLKSNSFVLNINDNEKIKNYNTDDIYHDSSLSGSYTTFYKIVYFE